ncbi:hypothetical protein BC937DRAFT_86811 [Endogone sp. FLAS-F59071]|nr:hypothetical protein BC937DRAFT_86811 [Endogone sp. FLAS-F59071]|eukprot:RUS19849.1 hypothetical protein BC937DRAFT_86811 [Endogone sp. FLAS-F59071]
MYKIEPKQETLSRLAVPIPGPYATATSPNACPICVFCPASTLNLKSNGASNTSTTVEPRQNPPISSPATSGFPPRDGFVD